MSETKKQQSFKFESPALPIRKQILFFSIGWLGFQFMASIVQIIVGGIVSAAQGISLTDALRTSGASMAVNALAYIILFVTLLLIAYTDVLKLLKSFKQWQSYVAGVVCFGAIIVFNIFYGNIVALLKQPVENNINQQAIESLESVYPFTSFVIFGIVGPICEELTYRVGLFSLCKRKSRILAYAVTIVIFALIHFNYSTKSLVNELLNLPYYAFAAVAFSVTFEYFGFAGSVTGHIINNIFSLAFISTIH